MAEPYVGEIRTFGFNFAPSGWALCNGQMLAISQFQTLYAVIGTTYGGDGQTTFATPNLQNSAPMHWGNGAGLSPRVLGEIVGTPTVTLLENNMPVHTHLINGKEASSTSTQLVATATPTSSVGQGNVKLFAAPPANATFSPSTITHTGGGQAHENMQPYLTVNFCIAFEGIYPTRN